MDVSIVDVAKRAGVGKSTVSRVLTGSRRVRPETRARVEAAMQAMGYRPNGLARAFVTGRTRTLGLVVHNLHNPFFGLLAQGMEAASRARGYNVLITDSGQNLAQQQECLSMLAERRVDGILVVLILGSEHEAAAFQRTGVRIVFLNAADGNEHISTIGTDNVRGGLLATRHLLDLGHRRVGFIGNLCSISACRDRLAGYRQAHAQAGIAVDRTLVVTDLPNLEAARTATHKLLDSPDPPTALFAVNDEFAMASLQALAERGRCVPDEMAVVGFDDTPLAAWLSVPLTTVAQPIEEQGRLAADLLIDHIEQPELSIRHIVLQPRLIVRESCGARRMREKGGAEPG